MEMIEAYEKLKESERYLIIGSEVLLLHLYTMHKLRDEKLYRDLLFGMAVAREYVRVEVARARDKALTDMQTFY